MNGAVQHTKVRRATVLARDASGDPVGVHVVAVHLVERHDRADEGHEKGEETHADLEGGGGGVLSEKYTARN